MKTWKKVLIGIVILGVVLIGLLGYGIVKMTDAITEKLEPDMQQYVQMSTEEQNRYVLEHMDDFMSMLKKYEVDEEDALVFDALKNDPAVRQAGVEWGRSMCATIITGMDSVASKLEPAELEKYEKEAREEEARSQKLTDEINRSTKGASEKQ